MIQILCSFEEKPSDSRKGPFWCIPYCHSDGPERFCGADKTAAAGKSGAGQTTRMGKAMWFLIKGAFWFSLVLVLLPLFDTDATQKLEQGPAVELGDTVSAASEAISYLSAMCLQKPEVCEKGAEAFVALGHRAREGAHVAYKLLDSQFADPSELAAALDQPLPAAATAEADADNVVTGTVAVKPATPAADALLEIIAIPTPRPDPAG